VGWIFYRPLLGLTLLAMAVGAGVWLIRRARAPRLPAVPPAMVPPPPPPAPAG
jgi:hypothetical protein